MTTALITGASSGIGAVFARRLAARGYDLVLVARATDRLNALATELRFAHGVAIEVITADLTDGAQLEAVRGASPFRSGDRHSRQQLAGAALISDFATADPAEMDQLVRLNVLVPTLLTSAAIGGMVERGSGSIVNIASVLALLPEYSKGIYAATKSYVLTLSQSCCGSHIEGRLCAGGAAGGDTHGNLRPRWRRHQQDLDVMEVEDLVDAALVGFDRKELVRRSPPVPDVAAWEAFEQARGILAQGFSNSRPGARRRP